MKNEFNPNETDSEKREIGEYMTSQNLLDNELLGINKVLSNSLSYMNEKISIDEFQDIIMHMENIKVLKVVYYLFEKFRQLLQFEIFSLSYFHVSSHLLMMNQVLQLIVSL